MFGVIFHWELNNREKTMCDIQLFGRLKEYPLATTFMVEQKWPWKKRTQKYLVVNRLQICTYIQYKYVGLD